MPNWASSHITIRGKAHDIIAIKAQLSQPYDSPWNGEPNEITGEPLKNRTVTGDFLLWNIVKPTDLHAYLERDKKQFKALIKANPELQALDVAEKQSKAGMTDKDQMSDIMQTIMVERATAQDWYNWNCRNWGTKWDTNDEGSRILAYEACLDDPTCMRIVYEVSSAWSPPVEALHHLAQQYPDVSIHLDSIDEGDCFAMTADWENGDFDESEVEITHDFGMTLRGYCNLECCEDFGGEE